MQSSRISSTRRRPSILDSTTNEIQRSIPFTINECLRTSRKRRGYHVFLLLFRIQFQQLSQPNQNALMKENHIWESEELQLSAGESDSDEEPLTLALDGDRVAKRKEINKLGQIFWRGMHHEKKMAFNSHAAVLNSRPPNDGVFKSIPAILLEEGENHPVHHYISSECFRRHVLVSLTNDWMSFVSSMRNAIMRKATAVSSYHEPQYTFGKETFLLSTQVYRSNTLNQLLHLTLFGSTELDNSRLLEEELVEDTKSMKVIHFHSYRRLKEIFSHNGLNGIGHFKNADNHTVYYSCCGKIFLRRSSDNCEAVGFILDERNDELCVMIDGKPNDSIWLPRPTYSDDDNGSYTFSDPRQNDEYTVISYWPVRFKVMKNKTNRFYMTLNRVQMEYHHPMDDDTLCTSTFNIEPTYITRMKSPLM